MDPTPKLPITPLEQEPILGFEEFISLDEHSFPRHNNFFLRFEGGIYDYVLKKEWYKKFASEHPDMEKSLRKKIQNRERTKGNSENLKPFERDLYIAYKIMRGCGASDRDLFS